MPDPAAEWRYRRQLCHEAYDRGYQAGLYAGHEQFAQEQERIWRTLAKRIVRICMQPSHAELQQRRAA